MTKRLIMLVAGAIVSGVLLARPASSAAPAQPPPMPASFYVTVTLNGNDVPAGTPVSAWVAGVRCATAAAFSYEGHSMYALGVPADDPATPERDGGRPGDTIVFHIGELPAGQTATWQGGTNTVLDLSATNWRVFLPLVLKIGD